jgi:hypothetical protein
MTRILAVDPGSEQSAWLLLAGGVPEQFGIDANEILTRLMRVRFAMPDIMVVEQIESYGMPVGREVFDTVWWAGRFAEASEAEGCPTVRLPRRAVKLELCGTSTAKDANVRQALIDRFGGPSSVGTTKQRGPLYGIHKDVWSALAIAVTFAAGARPERTAA